MTEIDFCPVGATDYPPGPDWFEVVNVDTPLYFVFTNTQLSANLSLKLGDFDGDVLGGVFDKS